MILKDKIEEIYEKKTEGARRRSKYLTYEGEKSSKFFLNLEKRRDVQGQIRKLIVKSFFSMKLFLEVRQQILLRTANVF